MRRDRVYIVGVAPDGNLSPPAQRLIEKAEIVFGGERLLQMFPSVVGEKVIVKNNLDEVAGRLSANLGLKRMIVLASGDPSFFGIARILVEKVGRRKVEIIPNVSSMQVAFARIKESWDDATLVSVHSRRIEDILGTIRSSPKVGIFTDNKNTPGKIARVLLEHGLDDCRVHVCQDLGSDEERVTSTSLRSLSRATEFSPLSIMILVREVSDSPEERLLGIPDEMFSRKAGLITKLEVRAVSLAKLALKERSVVWDIGAGSGAVSIEASLLARRGHVFAIEKDGRGIANIRRNIRKFRTPNITVVQALAPDGLEGLPDPSAVFIGGSGGEMGAILDYVCRRLKPGGRVVGNIATIENLHRAVAGLEANGFAVETTLVNIARSRDISGLTRMEGLNPVFIVTGSQRGADKSDR